MRSLETTNFYKPKNQMSINSELREFVIQVIAAVPDAIKNKLNSRWSLGEFGLISTPPKKYLDICQKLSSNDLLTMRRNMFALPDSPQWDGRRVTGKAAFGIFALILFADLARENANDGKLWPNINANLNKRLIQQAVQADLFQGNTPSTLVKEAIEEAVNVFRLRNVINVKNVQPWYTTLTLQYGFSIRDWRDSPLGWLRGANRPRAVEMLLGATEETADTFPNAPVSDSFLILWRNLQKYRHGKISHAVAKSKLIETKWISVQEADPTLLAVDRNEESFSDLEEDDGRPFTRSAPNIIWSQNAPPTCLIRIELPKDNFAGDDSYSIAVNDQQLSKIFYDVDKDSWVQNRDSSIPASETGSWIRYPSEINPWSEPLLRRLSGEVIDAFCLEEEQKENQDEPLVLYPWSGVQNGWSSNITNSDILVLVLPPSYSEVTISGAILRENFKSALGWRYIKINCANISNLKLEENDEEIWRAPVQPGINNEGKITHTVEIENIKEVKITVSAPYGIRLTTAEIGGNACDVRGNSVHFSLKKFGDSDRTLTLRLNFRDSATQRQFSVRRIISYPRPCLLVQQGTEFLRHPYDSALCIGDETEIRISIPRKDGNANRNPYITESFVPILSTSSLVRTQTGARLKKHLISSGSHFLYQTDLFNSTEGATILAKRVIWTGIIGNNKPEFKNENEATIVSINTTEILEARPEWKMEILKLNGELLTAQLINSIEKQNNLQFKIDQITDLTNENTIAVRIWGATRVLGYWSKSDVAEKLAEVNSISFWNILQSWNIPINMKNLKNNPKIKEILAKPELLFKQSDPEYGGEDYREEIASRHEMLTSYLLWDYKPEPSQARDYCNAAKLLPDTDPARLEKQILELSTISPWLAFHTLAALDRIEFNNYGQVRLDLRKQKIAKFLINSIPGNRDKKIEEAAEIFAKDFDERNLINRSPVCKITEIDSQFLLQMIAQAFRNRDDVNDLNMRLIHNLTKRFGRAPKTIQYCFGPLASNMLMTLR
jgi:hypothetical protein